MWPCRMYRCSYGSVYGAMGPIKMDLSMYGVSSSKYHTTLLKIITGQTMEVWNRLHVQRCSQKLKQSENRNKYKLQELISINLLE